MFTSALFLLISAPECFHLCQHRLVGLFQAFGFDSLPLLWLVDQNLAGETWYK